MRGMRFESMATFQNLLIWTLAVAGMGLNLGCEPGSPIAQAGLELELPASWKPIDPKSRMVPGTALAAWSGPQGSTLVLFSTLPIPGGSAESITTSLADRLTNITEMEVKSRKVVDIGNHKAARVEVVAPGTGDTIAPTSVGKPMSPEGKPLIPTREVMVAIAGANQTVRLSWTLPESSRDQILPDIEATLSKLRFLPGFEVGATQSY